MTRSLASRIVGRMRERRPRHAPMLPAPTLESDRVRIPREDTAPIFIVGCQRSGTSLRRRIVDSHSRIACPPETKFVLPLVEVLRSPQAMSGLESMGYGREEVRRALRRVIAAC